MGNKARTLIYPYGVEAAPIVRHRNLITDYEITGLASPTGWGLDGMDGGKADFGEKMGLTVSTDFNEMFKLCDTVFIADFSERLDFESSIYPKISAAVCAGKNIVFAARMDKEAAVVKALCAEKGCSFIQFEAAGLQPGSSVTSPGKLQDINAAVIFVLGMAEETGKFEIQLALRENILKKGYGISQVGSRHYCELMGFHSFPRFMFDTGISEETKIYLFNNYIRNIEIKEHPEVIIIGVPGGTMPHNRKYPNRFGITAFETANAVIPDAVICSTNYNEYTMEFFDMVSTSLKYRLGVSVDCFNLCNTTLDYDSSRYKEKLQRHYVNADFVERKKKDVSKPDRPVFNIFNKGDDRTMTDFIVDRLEGYVYSESL